MRQPFAIVSFVAFLFWISPLSAAPDARMNAIMSFCQTDTAIPAQTGHWLDPAPDGKIRGPRNAATLYGEAKKAQHAGDNLNAVRWILLCLAHDSGSYDHVANNNGMVIDYLAAH